MTKRGGNTLAKNAKKPKIDDDLENLWEDDLDQEALDNFIKVATQVEGKNDDRNDITILPTYNTFKQSTKTVFSSTQMEASFISNKHVPGPSKATENNLIRNNQAYQLEIVDLRQRCEEKEGEAAILRSQLKEVKASVQHEQEKKQQEWIEKLASKEKQINSLKTQLDFKNLEIANLKQKISDVAKRASDVNLNCSQNNLNQFKSNGRITAVQPSTSKGKCATKDEQAYKIQAISESVYPLRRLVTQDFPLFEACIEDNYVTEIKTNSSDSDINPYLQKRLTQSETKSVKHLKPKHSVNSTKDDSSLEHIYQSIASLLNCTEDEINAQCNRGHIHKILCFALQVIEDLNEYLNNVLLNTQSEDIQALDRLYLSSYVKKRKSSQSDQIAVKAGRCMYILSELLLHSNYLKRTLLLGEELYGIQDNNFSGRQAKLMEKLLNITALIGQLRKTHLCVDFLIGVIKFLTSICKTPHFDSVSDIFCMIVKEIIFSRPNVDVLEHMIDLFFCASQHAKFSESLCNKPSQSNVTVNLKKGTLFFNEESCPFHVFVILVNNTIMDVGGENSNFSLPLYSKLLCSIENILQANCRWVHHKEGKRCECLDQFYKLSVEIIYKVLGKYKENKKKYPLADVTSFFKYGIKVMSLIAFNSYDLTEKYITVYSQFKEIIHSMVDLKDSLQLHVDDLNDLDKLNISEDVPVISSSTVCF